MEICYCRHMDMEIYCLLAKLPLIHFSTKPVNNVKFLFKFCELWRQMKQLPAQNRFIFIIRCTVLQNLPGIVHFVLGLKNELSWDWEES